MTKIYTKAGDLGRTSLFGGKKIDKNSIRIKAYGDVDELNCLIGIIVSDFSDLLEAEPVKRKLQRIQKELFVLGTDLATPPDVKAKIPRITKGYITQLEKEIKKLGKDLPKLRNFILPGGGKVGARFHLARSVTRRTERSIVSLSRQEEINKNILSYINRLSDWFFMMARYVNKVEGQTEEIWKDRR